MSATSILGIVIDIPAIARRMDNGQKQCSKCSTSGTVFDNMNLIICIRIQSFVEQKEGDGTRNFKLVSTISRNTFTSGRVKALVLFDIDSSLHRLSQIIANSR